MWHQDGEKQPMRPVGRRTEPPPGPATGRPRRRGNVVNAAMPCAAPWQGAAAAMPVAWTQQQGFDKSASGDGCIHGAKTQTWPLYPGHADRIRRATDKARRTWRVAHPARAPCRNAGSRPSTLQREERESKKGQTHTKTQRSRCRCVRSIVATGGVQHTCTKRWTQIPSKETKQGVVRHANGPKSTSLLPPSSHPRARKRDAGARLQPASGTAARRMPGMIRGGTTAWPRHPPWTLEHCRCRQRRAWAHTCMTSPRR